MFPSTSSGETSELTVSLRTIHYVHIVFSTVSPHFLRKVVIKFFFLSCMATWGFVIIEKILI